MTATNLNGKERAQGFEVLIRDAVQDALMLSRRPPGLAVILVGEDPPSKVYVAHKEKFAHRCGFHVVNHHLPEETTELEIISLIKELNKDATIDGILVQMPLPRHINANEVIVAMDPQKDADGLHPLNQGYLFRGEWAAAGSPLPCTPLGILKLLDSLYRPEGGEARLAGQRAVVIGRSVLVGRPIASLLLSRDATVTIAHSKTADLAAVAREADLLVAAVGVANLVKDTWVKPGAVVIDVGINRMPDGKLVGDVEFSSVKEVASAITPVPGGVGPMTVAMLMLNTYNLYARHQGAPAT